MWKEVAGDWECGTEMVDPRDLVSSADRIAAGTIAY